MTVAFRTARVGLRTFRIGLAADFKARRSVRPEQGPRQELLGCASPKQVDSFPLVGGVVAKDLVFATSFPSADPIESITIVSHKFTRSRKIYHSKQSALKILYMPIHAVSKRWTMPIRHWKQAQNHSAILYEDRMPELTSK